jgi:hypothetical protein
MDPFLENPAYWSDFHATFINYWREAIADALPPNYEATLGERVFPIEHEIEQMGWSPGFRSTVFQTVRSAGRFEKPSHRAELATEPVSIPLTILDGPRETYIEILHQPDRSLVTALELLSPANKEQPGRTEYLAKRMALLYQKVHLVELDLLVGGRRLPMEQPLPAADYYYFLSRSERRPDCQVYHWTLRERLPALPVPLRAPDPDVHIDLAAVFTTAYDRGRFGRRINYEAALPVPLQDADRHWLETIRKST